MIRGLAGDDTLCGAGRRRPAVRRQWQGQPVRQGRHRPVDRRSRCRPVRVPRDRRGRPDGPAYEEILDFNRGQGDKIDLRAIDANAGAAGNQKFAFVGAAAHWPGAAACRGVRRRLPGHRQCQRRSGGRLRHRRAHRPCQLAGRRLFALSRPACLAVAVPSSRPTSLQPKMEAKAANYHFIVIGLTFLAVGHR